MSDQAGPAGTSCSMAPPNPSFSPFEKAGPFPTYLSVVPPAFRANPFDSLTFFSGASFKPVRESCALQPLPPP